MGRDLPPVNRVPENVEDEGKVALPVDGYEVNEWTPERDGKGSPTQVWLTMRVKIWDLVFMPVIRMKSPRAVNELIAVLERHRNSVWPGQ